MSSSPRATKCSLPVAWSARSPRFPPTATTLCWPLNDQTQVTIKRDFVSAVLPKGSIQSLLISEEHSVLNRYPLWKYLMVIVVIANRFSICSPQSYWRRPGLASLCQPWCRSQTRNPRSGEGNLDEAKIPVKHAAFEHGFILIRFNNTEDQLKARDIVANKLGDNFITALNLAPSTPAWLEAIGAAPLKLGLDLQGRCALPDGSGHTKRWPSSRNRWCRISRAELRTQKIRYSGVRRVGDQVQVVFRDEADQAKAHSFLRRQNADLVFTTDQGMTSSAGQSEEAKVKEVKKYALEQNITIIRNRADELGVAEPLVQQRGGERIIVELPGIQDTARARRSWGATATLEFHMVDEAADIQAAAAAGRVPPSSGSTIATVVRVVLQKRVILTGDPSWVPSPVSMNTAVPRSTSSMVRVATRWPTLPGQRWQGHGDRLHRVQAGGSAWSGRQAQVPQAGEGDQRRHHPVSPW